MQEEINELPEDILDLEVDYLGAIADMVKFGFYYHRTCHGILHILRLEICDRRTRGNMIDKQQTTLVKLIDQMRMLEQDQIRLQEKLNTVLEYREAQVFKGEEK